MVAQANKTSKNTTHEIEKMTTVALYTYTRRERSRRRAFHSNIK